MSSVAGIWAYFSPKSVSVALVVLLVFLSTLWCCIGFLWLVDRRKRFDPKSGKKTLDCSWGLTVDAAFIAFDLNGPEAQISVHIRSILSWPLRIDILEQTVIIGNQTPDQTMPIPIPAIAMPGIPIGMNFSGYGKGKLRYYDRIPGEIYIKIRYGHPDGNYSRVMERWFKFELQVPKSTTPNHALEHDCFTSGHILR